jgi:hypothetical protein
MALSAIASATVAKKSHICFFAVDLHIAVAAMRILQLRKVIKVFSYHEIN